MKTFFISLLLIFAHVSFAQKFNRSLLKSSNQGVIGTEIIGDSTLVAINGAEGFGTRAGIYVLDENGEIESTYLGPNLGEYSGGNGFVQLSNGYYLLYGEYMLVCDISHDYGTYFVLLDRFLTELAVSKVEGLSGPSWVVSMLGGSENLYFNGRVLAVLDPTYKVVRYDSLPTSSPYAEFESIIQIDSSRFLLTDDGTGHQVYNIDTDSSWAVLDSGEVYQDLNDSLFFGWKASSGSIKIFEKQSLQAVDSLDVSTLLSFAPEYVRVADDCFFLEKDENYALIEISDLSLVETDTLYTDSPRKGVIALDGDRLVVSTVKGHDQVHVEARKLAEVPVPIFGDLDLKVNFVKTDVEVDTNSTNVNAYWVWSQTEWKVGVINNSNDTLKSFGMVVSSHAYGTCTWPDDDFHYTNLAVAPGDSTEFTLPLRGYSNIIWDEEVFDIWLEVRPAYANGNILGDVERFTTTRSVHIGMEEESFELPKIYPNPVKDVLHFEGLESSAYEIFLYNMNGMKLHHLRLPKSSENPELDLSFLPAGSYLLQLSSGDVSFSRLLIKM